MEIHLFGKSLTTGDKILLEDIKKQCKKEEFFYYGEKVDLSLIKPSSQHQLIIVSNPLLFNIDITKVVGMVKKDLDRPLIMVKKLRSFGGLVYKPNLEIDQILVNKIFVFSGLLYVRKEDLRLTMSETLKSLDIKKLRSYIV
jgi:hypothetical protein